GISDRVIRESLKSFRGLEHRLEFVRNLNGVAYYNDSKSTAPTATVVAIQALVDDATTDKNSDRRIICIVGGQRKDASLAEVANALTENCRVVICTGESGPDFTNALHALHAVVEIITCAELADAIEHARKVSRSGDAVLFSPGAPSFDQYVNFTERGK